MTEIESRHITRRQFAIAAAGTMVAACTPASVFETPVQRTLPRPTPAQLAWQRDELAMFVHFGMNTFTDREWGDGSESPRLFAPDALDASQWARTARDAGFRAMILTAKHHDGFCLWPTATTEHSVRSSPWRDGRGDVVREFVDACRAHGLRPGLYLSPWDRNHHAYGDSPRYNDVYCTQLTELLTRYGRLAEVWFDGANGEGPNGKKQVYDWPRFFALVQRLQPEAVIFSDAGPGVRWCGNENGIAGDPNWSAVDPERVPYPGASGPGIADALQHGDESGTVWRPAEADVSIRPGWFYHAADDSRVRTAENLVELYCTSVGRNAKLLLNVPPTRLGQLHQTDVAHLMSFAGRRRRELGEEVAAGRAAWRRTGRSTADLSVPLRSLTSVAAVRLEEDIRQGQRVSRFAVYTSDGREERLVARGTTVGFARILRFTPVAARRVRIGIEDAIAPPLPLRLLVYADAGA